MTWKFASASQTPGQTLDCTTVRLVLMHYVEAGSEGCATGGVPADTGGVVFEEGTVGGVAEVLERNGY